LRSFGDDSAFLASRQCSRTLRESSISNHRSGYDERIAFFSHHSNRVFHPFEQLWNPIDTACQISGWPIFERSLHRTQAILQPWPVGFDNGSGLETFPLHDRAENYVKSITSRLPVVLSARQYGPPFNQLPHKNVLFQQKM
jgi:hypothetical protein